MPRGVYQKKILDVKTRLERLTERIPFCTCWVWTGTGSARYGHLTIGGRNKGAHVAAYELYKGPVPQGFVVRHTCDNGFCVNPEHLVVGTQAQNIQDKVEKGRQAKGERHGMAKLTVAQWREICESDEPCRVLAKRYGIHVRRVYTIREKGWQNFT